MEILNIDNNKNVGGVRMVDNYDIALAALLHDIGKLGERAGVPVDEEWLKAIASYDMQDSKIEELVSRADKLSSGLDRKDNPQDPTHGENMRLYSIFQNIDIGKDYKRGDYYHRLVPIDISDDIFPIREDSFDAQEWKKEYADLLNLIEKDLEKELGRKEHKNTREEKERTYNKIYYILERYTAFVPYSTASCSDISLFEHLKTTSAIATCLNEFHRSGEHADDKFILLAGDVSGIQSFIYQVTEGEDTKENVSKNLRGKSFYINVLIDFMSKYIARELDLTISNILYCGGGTFQLLLPNTEKTKIRLEKIELEIQKYLYDKYKTNLGLVLAYIELDEEGIINYSASLTKLQGELVDAKNQKFLNIIDVEKDQFFIKRDNIQNMCIYCYEQEATHKDNICDNCNTHISLGEKLVKNRLKYIVYDFEKEIEECDVKVSFGPMGQVCFFKDLNNMNIGFMVENINGTGSFGRLKFVGNTVPIKEGVVASFNDIGLMAEGDDKIAVLKMDIDNLGAIFSTGFRDENKSIARTSTLSRMIELFFCGYINKICEDLYNEYIKENTHKAIKLNNLFYINFSGGDDLVIIGPWDWTITLARRIREELSRFACYNPNITISGGICIADAKTPVRITLYEGEKHLEKAKKCEEKDALCIFERNFRWSSDKYSIEKVVKDGDEYTDWINREYLSRGLVYNIMVASKNIKRRGNLDFDLIPQIAYSLSRNIRDESIRDNMIERLITSNIKDSELEFIKYPLMIALMKTRDVKED